MKSNFRFCTAILLLLISNNPLTAQSAPMTPTNEPQPIQIAVWPKLAPGETTADQGHTGDTKGNVLRITDITSPQLFIYPLPNHRKAPALMICPGGAYHILATDLEGSEIAKWLNQQGYVAAVLHYRVPNKREGALQDAQRAMSLLRARADEFGIDPAHLGVIGFSAGGHLADHLTVTAGNRAYPALDSMDTLPFRPDFTMLIYPAYLTNLKTRVSSPEVVPVAGMPPMFLAQSKDDHYFCVADYSKALLEKNSNVQTFVYEKGGHGYGLRAPATVPASHWSIDAADWLHKIAPAN